jgi:molybdopterin/thiamine biosynthesis adenylyltransferase/rhodanese-related sulfurtransferase
MSSPTDLSPAELARYSRHLLLAEVGPAGQRALASARVLVVGAGGLGSPAALYLAAAGVGTLGIADHDVVAPHNLQRQLLHDDTAVGEPKVASAVRRLQATNPFIRVVPHGEGVTAANALGLLSGYDLVVDGTDNFPTRYLLNDAAHLAGRPLIHGSVFKFEGQVAVFAPQAGSPCYRCLFPEPPPPGSVPACGEAGVIGALCGVIGSLQAIEAVKLITGAGTPLSGRVLTYDALTATTRTFTLPPSPGCPLCGSRPTITRLDAVRYAPQCAAVPSDASRPPAPFPLEVSAREAKALRDAAPERILILDVREPYELEICRVASATHIPMRQVPESLEALPRDRHLLVLCHAGVRSLRVTEFLRSRGFPAVTNIGGGIDAWAVENEPGMTRY